jgi:hypothetical protein
MDSIWGELSSWQEMAAFSLYSQVFKRNREKVGSRKNNFFIALLMRATIPS